MLLPPPGYWLQSLGAAGITGGITASLHPPESSPAHIPAEELIHCLLK